MAFLKNRLLLAGIVVIAAVAAILAVLLRPSDAKAAGPWTGCGLGISGQLLQGTASVGGPVFIGADGQAVTGSAFCDWQQGSAPFVIGLFADYSRIFGDLKTIGATYDWSVGGRAGILVTNDALLYAHGEWLRVSGSSIPNVDGIGVGAGLEVKLPSAPNVSVDMRYTHDFMDNKTFGPSVDVRGDSIRLGLNFKLGAGPVPSIFDDRAPVPASRACDPKLASCK